MQRSLRVLLMLLFVGAAVSVSPAQAQQEISGTVTDAQNGETLPGATVSVVGTTAGTATDMNGAYTLNVGADADSLRFSFVGYDAQTVAIAGRSVIDVALMPSTQQLDDLVVIGYGSVEERDLTGSVAKVSAADFNQVNTASPEQLISGKIPGVQISSGAGGPAAETFVRIRGTSSVNADSEPLYVIDGVVIDNESTAGQRNPLTFLNPSEIENITVLKDASSTAIYGTRAANGVVIIETKSAEEGQSSVTYNGTITGQTVSADIDVLDAAQFRQLVRQEAPSSVAGRLGDTETDWQDRVQRDAFGQEHSLSFSQGFEGSSLRLTLNYLDQEGVLQSSSLERMSGSVKYTQNFLDDDLTIRGNLRGVKTESVFEPGSMVGNAASFDPTQPVRDLRSPFGGFYEWDEELATDNPVASYILEDDTGETYRSLGNVEAEYAIPYVDGLSARVNLGYDVTTGEREFFAPRDLKNQQEGEFLPGTIQRQSYYRSNTLLDAFLTYDTRIEDIQSKLNVTTGYSYQGFYEEYPEFTLDSLDTDLFGPDADVAAGRETTTISEIPSRLISVFGRINYTWRDKYLLTATIRRDGSSRFGPENQWATFPSLALGWRAHQEEFLDFDALSNLKFRASVGVNGNQAIPDFEYLPFYQTGNDRAQQQFGNRFITTIRPSAADVEIGWEETIGYNLAMDIGLFSQRLTGSVDLYRNVTDNLLFEITAAGGANLSNRVLTNIGELRNEGIEVVLSGLPIAGEDFQWDAQINASYNRNELLRIDREGDDILTGGISGGIGNNIQVLREGEPVNSFYTFVHKRDENGNPIYEDVNGDGSITPIDLYEDVNGDGVINVTDRQITGNPAPDVILGHTSQFRYKGADLSFTMRAHLGQQVYNNVASNFGYLNRLGENQVPTNVHMSVLETGFEDPQYFSDVYVEDASFLRLDNVTLGYSFNTLPGVERLRVYTSASNLFLVTGYSGPDPEVGGTEDGPDVGIDDQLYPRSRTFTAGVNVQL